MQVLPLEVGANRLEYVLSALLSAVSLTVTVTVAEHDEHGAMRVSDR